MICNIVFLTLFTFFGPVYQARANDYTDYLSHLTALKDSENPNEIFAAVTAIRETQTLEAYEIVVKRLEDYLDSKYLEPADAETREQQKDVVIGLAEAMSILGTQSEVPLFEELSYIVKLAIIGETSILADDEIFDYLEQTKNQLAEKSGRRLYSDIKKIEGYVPDESIERTLKITAHNNTLELVDRLLKRMRGDVEDQEDILNSIAIMYLKDQVNAGNRLAPEVFYYMGLPGNGKDSIVESFVKALHPLDPNALENHLFRMNIRNQEEAWSYFGSGKGYVGSDEFPSFLKFLVEHSGGRYLLVTVKNAKGAERTIVESNPEWKPGSSLGVTPDKAVVFINEAHNMPKSVKDNIFKQAIERGIFPITNPGETKNSVSSLIVPVTFKFATNEGISLLEPREKNGTRIGKPLSHEQLNQNYLRVYSNKSVLKQAVLQNNGERNNPSFNANSPGTSEEFLDRIPDHRIHLLKPLSPAALKRIVRKAIAKIQNDFANSQGNLGRYNITVSDDLIDFIVDYKYVAAENARPIKSRIENFITGQILDAVLARKIRPLGTVQDISIDLLKYDNETYSTKFKVSVPNTEVQYQFTRMIKETVSDRVLRPLSHQRVLEISAMREEIQKNVFGVEHIVDRLIEATLVAESEARSGDLTERSATVMAFLGKSSTGKTEAAKQFIRGRYNKDEKPIIIEFNNIKTVAALEAKILGSFDSRGNPIDSEFMKLYDRSNGRVGFIFDEAANAPKELLKSLYEILREPVATGFSDGKPRPMKQVSIILTGNAGEEIYESIPGNLPSDVYERALHEVFKIFISNEGLRHKIMLKTFPEAFLARLGPNIFHFGPLTHAGKRQVGQMKLLQGLKTLRGNRSEIGWDVLFKDEASLLGVFSMIEKEGFDHHSQGASIDKFVSDSIIGKIKARLLVEGIKRGEQVVLELVPGVTEKKSVNYTSSFRQMKLTTNDGKVITIEIPLGQKNTSVKRNDVDRALTAYHEVGHEIVSEVYFGDRVRPKFMTILEGVTIINDIFVHYSGIREGENAERIEMTKGAVLRRAAVLSAGYVAQSLVTLGGRHDSGKGNDIDRATNYIKTSILRFGLSEQWGMISVPENISIEDYISKALSNEEKSLLHKLTLEWLKDAEKMAVEALMLNAEQLLLNMSRQLAEQGNLVEDDILKLYQDNQVLTEHSSEDFNESLIKIRHTKGLIDEALKQKAKSFKENYNETNFTIEYAEEAYNFLIRDWRSFWKNPWGELDQLQKFAAAIYLSSKVGYSSRDAKFSSPIWMPSKMANIEAIILDEVKRSTNPVTELDEFNFLERTLDKPLGSANQPEPSNSCMAFLE